MCPAFPVVHHGTSIHSSNRFLSVITVTCDPAFHIHGNQSFTTTCNEEGEWQDLPTACEGSNIIPVLLKAGHCILELLLWYCGLVSL